MSCGGKMVLVKITTIILEREREREREREMNDWTNNWVEKGCK